MGDVGDDYKVMAEYRKARHRDWKYRNTQAVNACRIPHTITNHGESILFRNPGAPRVDFFPSTGRWRSEGKTYRGGASAFIEWYRRTTDNRTGG